MINVRVDDKTEAVVERLARRRGQTKSEVVRDALRLFVEREDSTSDSDRPYERVKHLIGCWSGGGRLSEKTGERFAKLLQEKVRERRTHRRRTAGGSH